MKLATFLSTILAAAVPLYAAHFEASSPAEFTFNVPAIYSGFQSPGGSVTLNLTGLNPSTLASIDNTKTIGPEQFRAIEAAIEDQIPDYISAVKSVMKLDECDLMCCEGLCFLIVWLPFFTAACIKICELDYGDN
ncbi:hypothetical protein V8F20_012213 [Naviculisporaceae sp. PSN 640]